MASQRKPAGARHPRSPLPRQQVVREKLKNVQRKPMPAMPSPTSRRTPGDPGKAGGAAAAPASRSRRMYAFTRGLFNVQ